VRDEDQPWLLKNERERDRVNQQSTRDTSQDFTGDSQERRDRENTAQERRCMVWNAVILGCLNSDLRSVMEG
jgi:hypothetical protein